MRAVAPERKEHPLCGKRTNLSPQPASHGMRGKENPELADEVYIPDYVMLDFGTLRNN